MNVHLYVWQRLPRALMVTLVLVHVAVIFYASRKGMTAADILARTRGSIVWASFYGAFVVAVAIHAAIGVRNVLTEWSPLEDRSVGVLAADFGLLLLALGARAVAAVGLPLRRRACIIVRACSGSRRWCTGFRAWRSPFSCRCIS